ncbi:Disease resistance protein L6 [Linum perenne]
MDSLSPSFATPLNRSESFFNYSSSSSTDPALPAGEYEVFLSFRGPDIRMSFADCLYSCLVRSRIRTFRDEEELRKGEQIAPSLVQAIIESKIHIPIFSQDYASSKWCLQELAKMVECWKQGKGHIILPIFYFMNPRDVRHRDGPYKQAFELHAQKHDADTVKDWREALQEVGKMKGWTVKDSDGQGAVIDEVFSRVDSHLMMNYKLVSDQDCIGIDFHVDEVMKLLDSDSQSVKVVSIHGIGGIGKTTIAKAVYDRVFTQFDRCCFLEDVRDTLTRNDGVLALQKKVISVILKHDARVEDNSQGIQVIKDRICKHKVLIVLDDIDDTFEFDKILGEIGDFSLGSRFLFTTRDRILNFHTEYKSYELGEMSHDYSLQLFSKHAFGMDYPPTDYISLSHKFVEAAAGLPLALKVIGSLLFRKDQKVWEEKLMQLKEVPPSMVQKRLKISYDALNYEEQQIFLDIACFFIGENKMLPIYMWSECKFYPECGIATLIIRSLIKVNESDKFWMHDHIRDLGRAIVRDENVEHPSKRSRIWSRDDALDMLKSKQMAKKLKVITLSRCYGLKRTPDLSECGSLELLTFEHSSMKGELKIGNWKCLRKLLIVDCEVTKLADNIRMLTNLEVINYFGCYRANLLLPKLPTSIKTLVISSTVPNLSELKDLQELCFEDCRGGLRIPGDIWKLSNLKTLIIKRALRDTLLVTEARNGIMCSAPLVLPSSLICLCVDDFEDMQRLPNLANLNNLKELSLTNIGGVTEIHGLGEVKLLVTLRLYGAANLKYLEGLENLVLLTDLRVENCPAIKRMPNFATLNRLCCLVISNCQLLTKLKGMGELVQSLSHLEIRSSNGSKMIETRNWNQQLKMDSLSPNFATPLNRSESFINYSSSSSSGSALPTGEYEVFLSFRGPDVRTSFADCLYSCLIRSKIRTFRDEEELRKGEQIAPSLVQAIIESKIHIPIFSQDYASSKWCLQELAKMVECWKQGKGHIILPIFYFVNPRDVRHQDGPYKQAFELHAQKHDADTVKEWREALQEVGKMKGWTVKDSDGQGAIIDEVFSRVDSFLMRNYKLVADEDLVGVDFHVEQVVKLLDLDSQSVAVVSIHGIGGSGKTTISKAVYDKVCSQFDRCCFLEDVRETLKKNEGVVNLQNKVLSVILKHDYQVENASNGIHLITDRVCKHKILLILDDIDDMFEFEKILGNMDAFASGSRFVITTRDQILNFHQDCKSYELGEMSHDHSLQLFCKHAFRMDYPPEDYAILSSKFVEAAAGLPLALKVMGSLLFHKDMKIWEENLIRFKEIPPCKVQERLKISYDALTYEERQIFLDIACLFIGEDKRLPLYMWDGCNFFPESAINTLVLRSLIKINGSSRFWMHDHIRDLGRAIVRDEGVENPGKRSRIWSENDALDMLKNNQMARKLKVVYIENCNGLKRAPDLSACGSLEVLKLHYCDKMSGELHVGNFKCLKELIIRGCGITISSTVPNLSDLKDLEVLLFQQ